MRKNFAGAILIFTAIFALMFPVGVLKAADSTYDFGDAPDGGLTFYTGKDAEKIGTFPSKLASNGNRTTTTSEVWLGQKVDKEADSRQVNNDNFDDGISVNLKANKTSAAYIFVHLKKPGKTTGTAYINLFFDWNKDGKWEDAADDPVISEWAVRNFPIDLSVQTKNVMAYAIKFTAGKKVKDIWYRAIVTQDERLTTDNQNGQGAFQSGEVEDYGPRLRSGKRYGVICDSKLLVIKHGTAANFTIRPKYADSPAITEVELANSVAPLSGNRLHSRNKSRNIDKTGVRTFTYRSKKKDPPARVVFDKFEVRVRYGAGGKEAAVTTTCNAAVVHKNLKAKSQCKSDYTLTGIEGKFTESKELMGDTQVMRMEGSLKPIDTELVAMNLTGFEIPLDSQHPKLSLPQYIDFNINGAGRGSWQCELVPSTTGGAGTERCQGNEPLQFNVDSFFDVFFDAAVTAPNSFHMHLLSNGNVIGAVDLPKE